MYKTINDLKGKTLSSCQFTESDFFIRYLAQEAGLDVNMLDDLKSKPDPDKLNLVFCADGFGAGDLFLRDFKAGRGRLDGCVTWAPKTGEVLEGAGGKAALLASNTNILIVADVLIVNKGFAKSHPEMVAGLVHGLIEGNRMMTREPAAHIDVVAKAMKWDHDEAEKQLAKVHLANLPENQGFFNGTIDQAGSFEYIFESALLAYGRFVKSHRDSDDFLNLKALRDLAESGEYADSTEPPSRTSADEPAPMLRRTVRFLFQPNSSELDLQNKYNADYMNEIAQLLRMSPWSHIKLIGHSREHAGREVRPAGRRVAGPTGGVAGDAAQRGPGSRGGADPGDAV